MAGMIGTKTDNKNIGLVKNIWRLRQELDIDCLISANAEAIHKLGAGSSFFGFVQMMCQQTIVLSMCKLFEPEAKYELDSIPGVLRSLAEQNPTVLDPGSINTFVQKYGSGSVGDGTLKALLGAFNDFKARYQNELDRFKTLRDKWVAHGESGFGLQQNDGPSYDAMERLCNFAIEFYSVVSRAFISTGPANLNGDRRVRAGLKHILKEHGVQNVKTDLQ
ncbi:MAG: hypothetical protein ACE15C_00640 [Phycisphaerae bacterium]